MLCLSLQETIMRRTASAFVGCLATTIYAEPLEKVVMESPSAFSKSMLLMIICGILAFGLLAYIVKHCCTTGNSGLVRFRASRVQREPEEPAMEMQESSPTQQDSHTVHDVGQPCRCAVQPPQPPAGQDASRISCAGGAPFTPAHVV